MPAELGELDAGARTLRFSRTYAHPIDRVWRAMTEGDQLEAWFPQTVVGDLLTSGAPLRFESAGDGAPVFEGRVLRVEPPRLLEFVWGTDVVRLDLRPGDGVCHLTLTDTMDVLGKAARDGAGWHTCLDLLDAVVDGAQPPASSVDRWREVHPGTCGRSDRRRPLSDHRPPTRSTSRANRRGLSPARPPSCRLWAAECREAWDGDHRGVE